MSLTPLFSFDPIRYNSYTLKLKNVGAHYWRLEYMIQQLKSYKINLIALFDDEDVSAYIQPLNIKVAHVIKELEKNKDTMVKFIQQPITEIVLAPALDDKPIEDLERLVGSLIGKISTITVFGSWRGPAIDGVPEYYGTYTYRDGSQYKGYCFKGNRQGQGIHSFPHGNCQHIVTINGWWKDDQPHFPTVITFENKTERQLLNAADCVKWRAEQKAHQVLDSIKITESSNNGEYVITLSVYVDKVKDEIFQDFYQSILKAKKRTRYYFMFMGMTGTGKTSMIEFMLNVLSGQVHAAQSLRAQHLEKDKEGESNTVAVCRYEIQYIQDGAFMFGIDLIDTPGFADTAGRDMDAKHINGILSAVNKIPYLNDVSYLIPGSLTKNTTETVSVLCSVFSVLPKESMNCVSTIVTFTDDITQAYKAISTIQVILPEDRSSGNIKGGDIKEDQEKAMESRSKIILEFYLGKIRKDTSFLPEGMSQLMILKEDLLQTLTQISTANVILHSDLRSLENITQDTNDLDKKKQFHSLEEYARRQGFAIDNGVPKSKVIGSLPWKGGVHSTVCFSPNCTNMVCHQACHVPITLLKGDEKIRQCSAFGKEKGKGQQCLKCPSHCSYTQHVHSMCQLKWIENDSIARTYYSIQEGGDKLVKEVLRLKESSSEQQLLYDQGMAKLAKLKDGFRDLAILGDIRMQAEGVEKMIKELKSCIDVLNESEAVETQRITNRVKFVFAASQELFGRLYKDFSSSGKRQSTICVSSNK
eukprot:gene15633-18573_t